MSIKQWVKFLRKVKNNGDYHILTTCIKGYITECHSYCPTVYRFYKEYSSSVIEDWYQDKWNYEHFSKVVYNK